MKQVIIFTVVYFVIYLCYLFFVILRKKKLEKFKNNTYVNYLVKKNKLDKKKFNIKSLAHIVALTNAFIISLTFVIVYYVNNFILMMLLAFLILIPLQFFMYSIIGYVLKRRDKNV